MSKELIVKHNKLIESAYTMTTTEAKIVAKLTSLIDKDDEDFKEHIFKSADLLKELGLGEKNHLAILTANIHEGVYFRKVCRDYLA